MVIPSSSFKHAQAQMGPGEIQQQKSTAEDAQTLRRLQNRKLRLMRVHNRLSDEDESGKDLSGQAATLMVDRWGTSGGGYHDPYKPKREFIYGHPLPDKCYKEKKIDWKYILMHIVVLCGMTALIVRKVTVARVSDISKAEEDGQCYFSQSRLLP